MAYLALARKWRPKDFASLKGQKVIVQALTNALRNQRLHHAYLFTGTRGVGKTTIARIMAKCLNCEQGIGPEPCHECKSCHQISQGRFMDLIEVDAASKTKVEDTRELLDNVQYAPSAGRYKIYLIDEVHMLSNHSFNALLKTLEEPPKHCIFLLATTDPQKLPATVISRCLQFKLTSMQAHDISEYLAHILSEENIPFEERALQHLTYAAKGSMRDALSLLDQAIAYGNQKVETVAVRDMLSIVEAEPLLQLIEIIAQQQPQQAIHLIQRLAQEGYQLDQFLSALVNTLHLLTMRQVIPSYDTLDFDQTGQLDALAKRINPETLQLYYQVALTGQKDMGLAPSLQAGLEMTVLRMMVLAAPGDAPLDAKTESQITTHQSSPGQQVIMKPDAPNTNNASSPQPITHAADSVQVTKQAEQRSTAILKEPGMAPSQNEPTPLDLATSSTFTIDNLTAESWPDFIESLDLKGLAKSLLHNCAFESLGAEELHLAIRPKHQALLNPKQAKMIEEAIAKVVGKKTKLCVNIKDEPAKTPQDIRDDKVRAAKKSAHNYLKVDPHVQALQQTFDGQLLAESAELIIPKAMIAE